jgi:glc operon protein GlcG
MNPNLRLRAAALALRTRMQRMFLIGVALAMTGTAAFSQNINKFVVSDEAAKKTLMKYEISADVAQKITQACVDFAKKNNLAVSVFILSPTGQIVHAHRMDGQVPINIETARLKAESVLYTRDSSHARANIVANNLALQLRWSSLPVFPVSGGLPIVVDNQMIGAIGVGGSNKDEECAYTAVTSVVGPQPPLAGLPPQPQQQAR